MIKVDFLKIKTKNKTLPLHNHTHSLLNSLTNSITIIYILKGHRVILKGVEVEVEVGAYFFLKVLL